MSSCAGITSVRKLSRRTPCGSGRITSLPSESEVIDMKFTIVREYLIEGAKIHSSEDALAAFRACENELAYLTQEYIKEVED